MWEILVGMVTYLSRAVGRAKQRPEKLFRDHVMPLQEDLLLIHNDYIDTFDKLAAKIADDSVPMEGVVEYVEHHRKALNPVRVGSGEFAEAMHELLAARFEKKQPAPDSAEHLLDEYADAVVAYLYGAFELPEPDPSECGDETISRFQETTPHTRYTSFARIARAARREDCERQQLARLVDEVESELERSWRQIARQYGQLKAKCLI